jgi:hypothetical protein
MSSATVRPERPIAGAVVQDQLWRGHPARAFSVQRRVPDSVGDRTRSTSGMERAENCGGPQNVMGSSAQT